MKILVPLDMQGNEVRNVVIHVLAADPGSPADGQIWYNSTDDAFRGFDGTSVVDFGSAASIAASAVTYSNGTSGLAANDAQDALDELAAEKANLAGGATFTGAVDLTGATVTVPTAAPGDNDTSAASTAFVAAAIAALVDSAPGVLDTLNELAAALGDDPNFAATITADLATKTEKYTALVGDNVNRDLTVTHSLGTQWVVVQVFEVATMEQVMPDVELVDANNIELHFTGGPVPGTNSHRVVVIG